MSRVQKTILLFLAIAYLLIVSYGVYRVSTKDLFSLGYGFGTTAEAVTRGEWLTNASRMPVIPVFLAAMSRFGNDTLFATIVKNLLLNSLLLFALYRMSTTSRRSAVAIAFSVFILSFPQLVGYAFSLVPEEGYIIPVLGWVGYRLFLPGTRSTAATGAAYTLACALTYLVKSSMRFVCPIFGILYFLRDRSIARLIRFRASFAIVMLAWGSLSYHNTGEFRVSSSLDGVNFYKGNGPLTLKFYPGRSLDLISDEVLDWREGQTTWSSSDRCFREAWIFLRTHPAAASKLVVLRAYKMFLGVTAEGNGRWYEVPRPVRWMGVLYMTIFRVIFVSCLVMAVRRLRTLGRSWQMFRSRDMEIILALTFLGLVASYSLPYLAGFAYERHVLPLVVPTLFYAMTLVDGPRQWDHKE